MNFTLLIRVIVLFLTVGLVPLLWRWLGWEFSYVAFIGSVMAGVIVDRITVQLVLSKYSREINGDAR